MFAKLFETEIGQLLVKIDTSDECKPEVRIYFEPPELGVCSIAWGFNDDDDGWSKADALFEKVDQDYAIRAVNRVSVETGLVTSAVVPKG